MTEPLMTARGFYEANATNIVNVPRPGHPEDKSGWDGVRRASEAQFIAKDVPVMPLWDACAFAEAYAAARLAAQPVNQELLEALKAMVDNANWERVPASEAEFDAMIVKAEAAIAHAKAQSAKEPPLESHFAGRFDENWTREKEDQLLHQAVAKAHAQAADCPECRRLAALNNELTAELGLEVAAFENLQAECRRLREAQRWIPVEERVPVDYCQILIYGEGVDPQDGVPYCRLKEVRWDMDEHFRIEDRYFKVTHWRPMPDPPEAALAPEAPEVKK